MKCSVKLCKKMQKKAEESTSFHRYPEDEWKKEQWMSILKVDAVKPHSVVCSRHFHGSDFINNIGHKRMLFPSAMPYLSKEFQESQDELPTCRKFVCQELSNVEEENVANPNVSVVELQVTPVTDEILLEYQTADNDMDTLPSTSSVVIAQSDFVETNRIVKPYSIKRAMHSSDDDSTTSSNLTPQKKRMKTKLKTLREAIKKKNRTIKTLNGKVRRQQKRLDSLKEIIASIKKQNLINIQFSLTED